MTRGISHFGLPSFLRVRNDRFNEARNGIFAGFDVYAQPSPRRVDEVTGPMEASLTPSSCFVWLCVVWCGRPRLRPLPSSITKFLAVEELVKVIKSRRSFADVSAARNRLRETWGMMVS